MLRYAMPVTSVPRRMRSVTPAMKPSVVQLSSMSSHSRPICGIWMTWSMSQRLPTTAASAPRAAGAGAAGVPRRAGEGGELARGRLRVAAEVEARDLQPEGERHRILLLAARRLRRGQERGGRGRPRPGGGAGGDPLAREPLGGGPGLAQLRGDDLGRHGA